jgi:hypothetical protein
MERVQTVSKSIEKIVFVLIGNIKVYEEKLNKISM